MKVQLRRTREFGTLWMCRVSVYMHPGTVTKKRTELKVDLIFFLCFFLLLLLLLLLVLSHFIFWFVEQFDSPILQLLLPRLLYLRAFVCIWFGCDLRWSHMRWWWRQRDSKSEREREIVVFGVNQNIRCRWCVDVNRSIKSHGAFYSHYPWNSSIT